MALLLAQTSGITVRGSPAFLVIGLLWWLSSPLPCLAMLCGPHSLRCGEVLGTRLSLLPRGCDDNAQVSGQPHLCTSLETSQAYSRPCNSLSPWTQVQYP
jgi:hypothetical protein